MEDVFCRIIKGEIPCAKIYEDDEVLSFLDISQATKGHALVIPKKHYENFLECPKELADHIYDIARKVAKAEVKIFGAKGVNILTNVGEMAGQTVMHFHVHVIPRYLGKGDSYQLVIGEHDSSKFDLPAMAAEIGAAL